MTKFNIYKILKESAETFNQKTAVVEPATVDFNGYTTFTQLYQLAERLRLELANSGISPGSGVGIQLENGSQFIATLFALASLNAVVVPIGTQVQEREFKELLNVIPLSHLLCSQKTRLRNYLKDEEQLELTGLKLVKLRKEPLTIAPYINNPAFIRPTSGTTGLSKGVVLSHDTVLDRIKAANAGLKLTSEDSVCWVMPMAFHFVVSLILYVQAGVKIIVVPELFADQILTLSREHKATVLYASPSHYALLLNEASKNNIPSLRLALSTSAPLLPTLAEPFYCRFNTPLRQLYGIIELGLPLGNLSDPPAPSYTVGQPLPGYSYQLVDEHGQRVEQNGELQLKGPGMFDGYLSPTQSCQQSLNNGFFPTGDIAEIQPDGSIRIVGRKKNLIITGGNKVFPEEVESIINQFNNVCTSRVYSKHHPILGELVVADVVVNSSDFNPNNLLKFCRQNLSSVKVPQEIHIVSEIKTTATGKIRRW